MRFIQYAAAALIFAALAGLGFWQLRALQAARAQQAAWQPGAVEIGFAQFMSLHHEQAIAMAQLLQDGRPTRLQLLARSIEGAQHLELGEMRGWLRLWQQPLLPASRSMDWMLAGDGPPGDALKSYLLDCERSATGMPGLASLAELERLRTLAGSARDRQFLTLMLAHHQGAVPMAHFAAEQAAVPAVRALATRIVLEQSQEIDLLRLMQQALPATDP